ncbi:hypothetical protein [Virgibacillus halodenitrificans]|uniref:hypothetical protein n=1 Tax=Virgibacillus halodenitrificans TaxID=1482 RepID=UPI0007611927
MKVNSKLGIVIITAIISVSALTWYIQKEPYSTEVVVDAVWEKYEVQSTQIGGVGEQDEGEPTIFVDVYNKNDIAGVEKYLENNLSKADLKAYEIDVFSNKGVDY